ncbi:MAG: hypothetical protein ACLT1J_10375 [Mediterraneibacter gnavus]
MKQVKSLECIVSLMTAEKIICIQKRIRHHLMVAVQVDVGKL